MKVDSEWWHKDDVINALNERDKEIEAIKSAFDDRVKVIEMQLEDKVKLNQEIDSLKKQLSEAVKVIEWYCENSCEPQLELTELQKKTRL